MEPIFKGRLLVAVTALGLGTALLSTARADQSAGQELKDAGHSVASATRKTTHKVKHGVKKGVNKGAKKVSEGADKAGDKTAPN